MKIGVFGGCFNPPHTSHKRIAKELILKGYVDKIVFVPTSASYAKRGLVPFEHRIRMLEEMTKGDENMDISTISAKGYEYTYQVLDALQDIHPDDQLYFICGTDNLAELNTWKEYEYIISEYGILAVQRNGDDIETIAKKYKRHKSGIILTDVESGSISSTIIREALAANALERVRDYLDPAVLDYILKNKLYKKKGNIE